MKICSKTFTQICSQTQSESTCTPDEDIGSENKHIGRLGRQVDIDR